MLPGVYCGLCSRGMMLLREFRHDYAPKIIFTEITAAMLVLPCCCARAKHQLPSALSGSPWSESDVADGAYSVIVKGLVRFRGSGVYHVCAECISCGQVTPSSLRVRQGGSHYFCDSLYCPFWRIRGEGAVCHIFLGFFLSFMHRRISAMLLPKKWGYGAMILVSAWAVHVAVHA